MKKHNHGLVLGKFYPFHLGHKHLIDTAIKNCDIVYVLVCSLSTETINGAFRHEWIKETYKTNPNVKVVHIDQDLPQYPSECESEEEFYDIWCEVVYDNVEILDVVFTSEDYGDVFAEYLGIDHFLVDKDRVTVPVSGTMIREDLFNNWDYLPEISKTYFTKRVAILGTESAGKSTMAKRLADHFEAGHVEEYGRTYTDIHGTNNLEIDDFEKIVMGQNDLLFDKLKEKHKLLICDTEAITTKVFGDLYVKDFESEFIDSFCALQKYDLYLLLDTDVKFINDGTREFEDHREKHLEMIKKELDRYEKPYHIVSAEGDYDKRFEQAVEIIEKKFGI